MGGRGYRPALHIPSTAVHMPPQKTFSALCADSRPGRQTTSSAGGYIPLFRGTGPPGGAPLKIRPPHRPSGGGQLTPAVNRELDHAWQRIDAELRRAVTDSTYAIWLEPLRPAELTDEHVVVVAPDHLRSWVADRYGPLLEQ